MAELFASLAPTPLAERLRPGTIHDVLGQDHLLGRDGAIGRTDRGKVSDVYQWSADNSAEVRKGWIKAATA